MHRVEAVTLGLGWTTYGGKAHARPVGTRRARSLCGQPVAYSQSFQGSIYELVTCKHCLRLLPDPGSSASTVGKD